MYMALDRGYNQLEDMLWDLLNHLLNGIIIIINLCVYIKGCVYVWHGVPVEPKGQPQWQQSSASTFTWVTGNKFI